MTTAPDLRKRELAQIHIAKAQLGMDDETYRAMLWTIARVKSAGDLDWAGRKRVLDHFKASGAKLGGKPNAAKPNEWAFIDRAATDRQPLLRKICVLCRELGIERGRQKKYVEGIARQMQSGAVAKPLEFCDASELWCIAAALNKQLQRRKGAA